MYSRFLIYLISLTSFTINTLHAQYDQVGQVVLQKGTLSVYEWNEFVMYCEAVEIRTGIPAALLVGISLHESAYFSSTVYDNSFNAFGILAYRDWSDKPTYQMPHRKWNNKTKRYDLVSTPSRKYANLGESVYDFPNFINKSWYSAAWDCGEDVPCWLQELHAGGYAEDVHWSQEITEMLVKYGLSNGEIITYSS
ncbi:MAG: flagellum-specific peptidoglycan hydrolase FlgJ [Saprospiraceae bacterium]|jgi:flagellum-specific peptidoglycan hydrolase FlgJ